MLLGFTTAVLLLQHAASFTVPPSTTSRNYDVPVHREHRCAADAFFNNRRGCAAVSRRRSSTATARGTAAVTELRISEKDIERDLKFERDLDRDAQLWVNGDPKKQELWEKAKSWRNLNKSEFMLVLILPSSPFSLNSIKRYSSSRVSRSSVRVYVRIGSGSIVFGEVWGT